MKKMLLFLMSLASLNACRTNESATTTSNGEVTMREPHRPQIHFSPREHWMNDPNGMVRYGDTYHLFFQYYPDGMTWGPMHWGHATSKDLVHWEHLPIALYPDKELGLIFSGSAVVDHANTTGFGSAERPPLVAVFTFHSQDGEKAGKTDYQTQGIAFSLDSGATWKMYEGNPVLPNQGIKDFRDPKVFWYDQTGMWIMILAVADHIELWGSSNLKQWTKLSEFGKEYGAHGGVWECPDLFPLRTSDGAPEKWVMLVSINPGGPNGGSATQYFTGTFDGRVFTPDNGPDVTTWLDFGPDNYAGVTWSNAPDNRKIFLGWMSNWAYAQDVPTTPWRSAMTIPRDLSLKETPDGWRVASMPSPELKALYLAEEVFGDIEVSGEQMLTKGAADSLALSMITGSVPAQDFAIEFSNDTNERISVGYDKKGNRYFIDRSSAGDTGFSNQFNGQSLAPRLIDSDTIRFTIVSDVSSIEVFFDDGLSVMTALFFPTGVLSEVTVSAPEPLRFRNLRVRKLKSIWKSE